jgi:syntaxin 5
MRVPYCSGGQAMQQQLSAPQDTYMSTRAEALRNVESTIVELGGIFQQLAHMVRACCSLIQISHVVRPLSLSTSSLTEIRTFPINFLDQVQEQGEMAVRIDENVEETLQNVDGAQAHLLKYLNTISSNRWLIMKIFFVLMIFMLFFTVFIV